jgi:hypothetical protein
MGRNRQESAALEDGHTLAEALGGADAEVMSGVYPKMWAVFQLLAGLAPEAE